MPFFWLLASIVTHVSVFRPPSLVIIFIGRAIAVVPFLPFAGAYAMSFCSSLPFVLALLGAAIRIQTMVGAVRRWLSHARVSALKSSLQIR